MLGLRYPHIRWNYHQLILEKKSFQLSTNGIESINRSIKHYLGLGNCNQDRLDREMNLYHRQKVNAASAALNHGRMKKIRRETLAHQDSLFKSLKDFESLSEHNKLKNLKYHLLDLQFRPKSKPLQTRIFSAKRPYIFKI